jgi:hypothetical protein
MKGYVAALDGWLCHIHVLYPTEVKKIKSYFSCHYQCYGLYVQVTYDISCYFTSIAVLCPGGASDSKAFPALHVYSLVLELPYGYFSVADNAYTSSTNLLIPHSSMYG